MASQEQKPTEQHERPPFEYKRPPPGCVAFITIPATDEARAQKFYEHVFSWNFWTGRGVTVFFTNGGEVMGRIVPVDKVSGEPEGTTSSK
jgi:predicted enzyme related to lactoylglutathione lyase